MVRPYIPKEDDALPDAYGVTITYHDNKVEVFEVAQHAPITQTQTFDFVTKDDLIRWIPMTSIKKIEFDLRWSKTVAIWHKLKKQKAEAGNG